MHDVRYNNFLIKRMPCKNEYCFLTWFWLCCLQTQEDEGWLISPSVFVPEIEEGSFTYKSRLWLQTLNLKVFYSKCCNIATVTNCSSSLCIVSWWVPLSRRRILSYMTALFKVVSYPAINVIRKVHYWHFLYQWTVAHGIERLRIVYWNQHNIVILLEHWWCILHMQAAGGGQ